MKKSHRILMALDEATAPMTCDEIAAAIDEPDEGKSVGILMCSLRNNERVSQVGKDGQKVTWTITEAGREFITDVLSEQQDDAASEAAASRRVLRAERARRDPDGPPPPRRSKKRVPKASVLNDALAQPLNCQPGAIVVGPAEQSIAVRDDGAVLVLERNKVIATLLPELAMRIAGVVRRLRAE